MATLTPQGPPSGSFAELHERLGCIPLERIRAAPPPGTATEADLLVTDNGNRRLCELVDGVLVEKAMGFYEARLAAVLIGYLEGFLRTRDLGIVLGADGLLRLWPGLVRIPDVAFLSWSRFPGRRLPREAIPELAPDLAVEILCVGNTEAEMARKLGEYFGAGARLVWYLDPEARAATCYTSVDRFVVAGEDGVLEGDPVLPGFNLSVREWFQRAGERA